MTPSTPSISHIYALQSKLDDIFSEGVENRFGRHAETNALSMIGCAETDSSFLRRKVFGRNRLPAWRTIAGSTCRSS